jgi:hypothetical protein
MSTILVAAILVGSVAAICFFLVSIHNKHKHEAMNQLLNHFSQLGIQNNLSFSSQESLKDCMLGLDGIHRKMLVVKREDGIFGSFIIDLNEVNNCSVKKVYGTIKAGDLKSHKLEQYLEKIVLHFDLNNKPAVEIVFYKHFDNNIYQTMEMEQKARAWETILSKMLLPMKKIA